MEIARETRLCAHCQEGPARPGGFFCGGKCRMRAYRRRRAGLPENVFKGPSGARRGPFGINQLTKSEGVAVDDAYATVRDALKYLKYEENR